MPNQGKILPFLAKGFNNKDAIKVLMSLDDELTNLKLATNPYLGTEQINELLEVGSGQVRTVLAGRYDLTNEQLIKLIKTDSKEALLAILSKPDSWAASNKLSNRVALAITHQKGFNRTSKQAKMLRLIIRDDFPDRDLLQKPVSVTEAGDYFTQLAEFISLQIGFEDILRFADFAQYATIALAGSTSAVDTLKQDRYSDVKLLDLSIKSLTEIDDELTRDAAPLGPTTHLSAVVCRAVIDTIGPMVGEEFFSIFLLMLESWAESLTLTDALNTALTLLGNFPVRS